MFWQKRRVYLDRAAGAGANPSSPHEEGRKAKKILEDARLAIARLVEVQTDDVLFTSGATESNALAILGSVRAQKGPKKHALYLPSAHASIVENMKLLAEEGVVVEVLPIKDSRVDTDALAKLLRDETVLVSMEAVCGETGTIWNTREVAEVLQRRSGNSVFSLARGRAATRGKDGVPASRILLHIDASQAPLTEKVSRAHFAADLLTLDASKVSIARGIGALIAHRTIPLAPLYRGGGQERGLRSGSESPLLAQIFAAGLTELVQGHEAFRVVAEQERMTLIARLQEENIKGFSVNEGCNQVPHILNLSLVGRDTDYLVALLDEAGFAVSTRSACETDSDEGSRAVFALTGDAERARTTLRISWGADLHSGELERFVHALIRAIRFVDNAGRG